MKIKVTTPGKMIVVNGKPSRTPLTIKINNEQHLREIESICRIQSLEYHMIEDVSKELKLTIEDDINSEPVIEELKTGSILDELTK